MSGQYPLRQWDEPTRTAVGSTPRLTPGSLLGRRYRIVELVGAGAMGLVYRAEDERLGLPVAIKVLRPDLSEDERWLARFQQELVLARQVSHPNVVRIHDIGSDRRLLEESELVFLTMDFIPGRSLRDLLAERAHEGRRLSPEEAVEIARQLALGLGAAHQAGVVHRDLKPGNVLIDEGDDRKGRLRVAITDFGVARSVASSNLTRTGAVVGTLGYLSPEQARGEAVDGRSDLYALGLLLYEMLTGELPFSGATEAETLAQRLSGAPRKLPWRSGAAVPPQLAAIVQKLLARDPADRYAQAAEVAADLDRYGAARPRRPFFRAWSGPRGRWLGLAAGLLALGAAVALGLAWKSRQAPPPPLPAVTVRHAVALLPLADETGRPELAWVASGIPEMLAASLAESPDLRVLDSHQVFRTVEDLKLPHGPLPDDEARRLAGLLDADRLIAGRVRTAGGQLRIDLTLLATEPPGLPAATFHAEAKVDESFQLVEKLGTILREKLAVEELDPQMPEPAASRSAPALADYAKGVASLLRGDAQAAVPALERAVKADPGYTAAWVRLAQAQEALGRGAAAKDAARRAVETLGPVESRAGYEARAIEARLLGHPERAQQILSQLLIRYPDDLGARIELAVAYGEQGSLDRALAELTKVVGLAPHHPRAWFLLGKYSIYARNPQRAVEEYLVKALVVQNELGSEPGQAEVLNAFGNAYRDLSKLTQAADYYARAGEIWHRLGHERGYAITLRNRALLHVQRGEYEAAEEQLQAALRLLQQLGDQPALAELYNTFGALAEQRGRYEEMLDYYRQALRIRRDLGNDLDLIESFGNIAFTSYLLGRYDDALVFWQQGLDLARKSADSHGVVTCTQNLGQLHLARGDWDKASASFLTALRSARQLKMQDAVAVSLGHLGRLAQYQGRPAAALASYAEALKILSGGDPRGQAEFTLGEAETQLELGRLDAADERLRAAGAILREGGNLGQQAELERLRGEVLLARGDRAAAGAAFRRAVSAARESGGVVELLAARLSAAQLTSLAELEKLRAEADTLGNARLRLQASELVARAALVTGDPARARQAARAGLEQATASGGHAGAYRLHGLLAAALERSGETAEAAIERRHVAEEIARVGRDLPPELRKSFLQITEVWNGRDPDRDGRTGSTGF